MSKPLTIPVLLLKTRSQPHDAYKEYFSPSDGGTRNFQPQFIPVLEHRPVAESLAGLEQLLNSGALAEKYGGMIFTSQRAVEAWADLVKRVEHSSKGDNASVTGTGVNGTDSGNNGNTPAGNHDASSELVDNDFAFPLYTVGPATSRALQTLVTASSSSSPTNSSPFGRLRPSVVGEHTGNGASLAQYILSHYNALSAQKEYTFYDAPRLPFIPLVGPSKGERLEQDDDRIRKKPLLFLVGEQRRDIIPKTLMDPDGVLDPHDRIQVEEVEVYKTEVMESFRGDFQTRLDSFRAQDQNLIVVVVFSPQGCESMLRSLGFVDESNTLTERGRNRWSPEQTETESLKSIVVTIGPTTRDHLVNNYAFEPDVCAVKPSAEGVGDGLNEFLKSKDLI